MDFLADYWTWHSAYEIPRNTALWTGLGLLGACLHRRVEYVHGEFEFHGNLYVGLIGVQGTAKSTCNDKACDLYREAFPQNHIGPSRASPEVIVKAMADPQFAQSVRTFKGSEPISLYAFFINEFANFVGRSPADMIALLTDIYDRKYYANDTILRGAEPIINPVVNMIACITPDWFARNLKGEIITGGFFRRLIPVYEIKGGTEAKPHIILTTVELSARARVKQRLLDCSQVTGQYSWGDGDPSYQKWYRDNFTRHNTDPNPIIAGYLRSKNVQLYKVMMLLDASSDKPMFLFTADLVEHALALLDSIEENMIKLSLTVGRNELAPMQRKVLDILDRNGGIYPEKALRKELETDVDDLQIYNLLKHLDRTDQVVIKSLDFTYKNPKEEGTFIKVKKKCVVSYTRYLQGVASEGWNEERETPG